MVQMRKLRDLQTYIFRILELKGPLGDYQSPHFTRGGQKDTFYNIYNVSEQLYRYNL